MELFTEDAIQEKILLRVPLKSLLACVFVCKKWKTMIYNKDFKDRYLLGSMTRPMDPTPDSFFHSVCQDENPSVQWMRSEPVRGVVCLQSSTRFLLCDPITTNVLPLPDIEGLRLFSHTCFLGYDEATGVFKVLWPRKYNKPLVYTVRSSGGGEGSWRQIACELPHIISPCALCKGGVLYYAAKTLLGHRHHDRHIIMCFNLNSEEFTSVPLPEGVVLCDHSTMVNYNGKVALVINSATELHETGRFQICGRNEDSGQWESETVVIHGWRDNVGNDMLFSFVGTIGTGELVFKGPASSLDGSESVLYYNTDPPQGSSAFKMFRIEADNGGSYHYVRACLNHFDCFLRSTS